MQVVLVGADAEENLGIGMVAAVLRQHQHGVHVVALADTGHDEAVARQVLELSPDLVGLGVQFQFRARDCYRLAADLRSLGYHGHITCGGQHATLSWQEILRDEPAIDSVVLHEGEQTAAELAAALAKGGPLDAVSGLALRGDGGPRRTAPRAMAVELDPLPPVHRYRPHDRHLGLPFIPVTGSRGCWGSCAFCAISAYYDEARTVGQVKRLRLRSPGHLATEMADLHRATGSGTSLFCFHDDTLLLPRPSDTVARLSELREELRLRGVTHYGLIGKGRPETLTADYARTLRSLGVVRLFIGIENASEAGQLHLHRGTRSSDLHRALDSLRMAGIMATYNLLLFEPDTRLEDVRENAAFMRAHAKTPGNFCRAEPYHGTRLQQELMRRGALIGDHRGWDYRIADDRVEVLFRVTLAAFRERNYHPQGVGNRYVALAYLAQLLRVFHGSRSAQQQRVLAQADDLVERISSDSADLLEQAIDRVERLEPHDVAGVEQLAVQLALRVATQDRRFLRELDEVTAELHTVALEAPRAARARASRRTDQVARAALASTLLMSAAACGGATAEPEPDAGGDANHTTASGDGGSPPTIGGAGGAAYTGFGGYLASDGGAPPTIRGGTTGSGGFLGGDGGAPPTIRGGTTGSGGYLAGDGGAPPIVSGGTKGVVTYDGGAPSTIRGGTTGSGGRYTSDGGTAPRIGGAPSTTLGGAGGTTSAVGSTGLGGVVGDGGSVPVLRGGAGQSTTGQGTATGAAGATNAAGTTLAMGEPVDHFRDTTPKRLTRATELPLHDPPDIALVARREGQSIRVGVRDAARNFEYFWSVDGGSTRTSAEILWSPVSPRDRLSLIIRHPGGVAATTLSAESVSSQDPRVCEAEG